MRCERPDGGAARPGEARAPRAPASTTATIAHALRAAPRRFAADPDFKLKPLTVLNAEALAHLRAGDDARCIAAFAKFFRKLQENNLTHREARAQRPSPLCAAQGARTAACVAASRLQRSGGGRGLREKGAGTPCVMKGTELEKL